MKHTYRCKYRPPMPGSVPRGFTDFTDGNEPDNWGTVTYNRELTAKEMEDYELEEIEE